MRGTLQRAFGPNAAIRTNEGDGGQLYVRIVSERFDGLSDGTKQDLIWEALRQELQEEAQTVALVLAFSPGQI